MGTQRADERIHRGGTTTAIGRRGILAVAGAVVAGIAAKRMTDAQPVAANNGVWEFPYSGEGTANVVNNVPGMLFRIVNDGNGYAIFGSSALGVGISAGSGSSDALHATGYITGVDASAALGNGVQGTTNAAIDSGFAGILGTAAKRGNYGVYGDASAGQASTSNTGTGVKGVGGKYGVAGQVGLGIVNSNAVLGDNGGGANGAIGVMGQVRGGSASTTGTIGIYGANLNPAPNSHGIVGLAQSGHGLVGTATNSNPVYAGLVGQGSGGASAGNFFGNVAITGNIYVGGSQTVVGAKSAALAHPDGSHRLVYCVEAPESWLEDFGEGALTNGKADVKLDPEFAAVADMSSYHVFVTEHGGFSGLHTTQKGATGFTVEADLPGAALKGKKASDLTGQFSWRVVAKRKDIKAARLAKFDVPELTPPTIPPPQTPDPSMPPKKS